MSGVIYRLGLIGYPLGHSYSPRLHNAALHAADLCGEYRLYPIAPDEAGRAEIANLLAQVRSGELAGLNVTIPHKQVVIPFMDRLTEMARAVGAVNTVYRDADGSLVGANTDVPGFLRDVLQIAAAEPGKALVLGAGGSARAVVYGLAQVGWQVLVLARRVEQAQGLVTELSRQARIENKIFAEPMVEDTLAQISRGCTLLVNTTPLGMSPHPDACPWPENLRLPEQAAVYDLVYNPLETVLVRRARLAGLPASGGAGMLINQAALSFQIWTGVKQPPYETMGKAFYQ